MNGEYRVLISGGGTGGHIYPALAIADSLQELAAGRGRSLTVAYVGSQNGLEREIVAAAGLEFFALRVRGLDRRLSWKNLLAVTELLAAVNNCRQLIARFRPQAVVGTGGFVCAPLLIAAAMAGRPILLQEQNAYPGLTNRCLSRFAKQVAVGYNEAGLYFPAAVRPRIRFTGNPLYRPRPVERTDGLYHRLGLVGGRTTVVITGGSRGAESINRAMLAIWPQCAAWPDSQWVWLTGHGQYQDVMEKMPLRLPDNLRIRPYCQEMAELLAVTDLVVSRAGAMALAEFAANRIPAILIPYPFAAGNHQKFNAQVFATADAAVVLDGKKLTGDRLWQALRRLLANPGLRKVMSGQAGQLARPQAADEVAGLVWRMMENDDGGKHR
ncbi:MAG: undecaprenyldiphospho-muramoylpentapeptide beta-N-acetylglucosaminyltransferase [Negativicutes bacterium]|nr:undecaprenyldiphospho-muramoylpentapeptide beta-N-acetylglucosaminyltransferase [Negativicutes bacterium]